MAFAIRGEGVSRAINVFSNFILLKNHLESLPDYQNAFCTYRVVFLTGPPDFQYQNEKQFAANQIYFL